MMRELSLNILDLVQNCITAAATKVVVEVCEDVQSDLFVIRIQDNGCGMDEEMVKKVRDPFTTTRTTRRVGLGLPLVDMAAKMCNGYLKIDSAVGVGTTIEMAFQHSHLDRPPLGNIVGSIKSLLILNPDLDFTYKHCCKYMSEEKSFAVSALEIKEALDGVSMTDPDVLLWLQDYLVQGMNSLKNEV